MKNFNTEDYENLLPQIKLTTSDIESQIKGFKLEFFRDKVNQREDFPFFVPPFYKFVLDKNRIPDQNEYWEFYQEENPDYFNDPEHKDLIPGIKARIFRNMPSFVRDLHFGKYLSEHELSVIYNQDLDMKEGTDLMITYKDKHYGLSLYTDTPDGRKNRDRKIRTRKYNGELENVTYVELPVPFKTSFICGDFFLYGEVEHNKVIEIIDGKKIEPRKIIDLNQIYINAARKRAESLVVSN